MAMRMVFGCLVVAMAASMWTVGRAADHPGERVYDNNCRRCHGPEGRGARGPRLVPFKWSDDEAMALIRRPLCDMPPFPESDLSNEEVEQIIAFLKTIQ